MARYFPIKTIFLFMLGAMSLVHAGGVTTQTLEEYRIIAAENNPGLKAKFHDYLAALEKVPQMGGLPDPEVSFGIFIRPMERYAGDQVGSVSLMQMFPWFGTLGAARNEAAMMAEGEFQLFREAQNQLFYEVKSQLLDLYLLEREIEVTRKNVEILKSLENIAVIRFSGGGSAGASASGGMGGRASSRNSQADGGSSSVDGMGGMGDMGGTGGGSSAGMGGGGGSQGSMSAMEGGGGSGMVDVLWVQMEVKELENALTELENRREALTMRFNGLLGRALDAPVSLPASLRPADLPLALTESIERDNPMLKMLEAEEKAFSFQEKMNKRMGLPMVGVGLQYDVFRAREGLGMEGAGHNMLMPMITLSLPIWRGKYRAAVNESALKREGVVERREDVHNKLMVSLAEIRRDFEDAARRMELYREQANLARQAVNILTAQYTGSGKGFEELLRLQNKVLDYELQWEKAVADNNLTVAKAEKLIGGTSADKRMIDAIRKGGKK